MLAGTILFGLGCLSLSIQDSGASGLPKLWIIGDSTVKNGSGKGEGGQWGWGDKLAPHFDPARITIMNRAIGGRSSRTFLTDGRWEAILKEARTGDFLLIQFGHNDPGPINDETRARGTIPGIGEDTQEIDNLLTKKKETIHTFGWYLRRYVREAKKAGILPILCTYVPRCPRPGQVWPTKSDPTSYRLWTMQVAEQEEVPCLDLFGLIEADYLQMSQEEIKTRFFCEADFTHTSGEGAERNARHLVQGLKRLQNHPLACYLKVEAGKERAELAELGLQD